MPTNPFFQHYSSLNEQNLMEDLITESIEIQGFPGQYILLEDLYPDKLFGDNPRKFFKNYFTVCLYLSNSVDPGLNGEFFSKFGLEIKNRTKVCISRREFNSIVQDDIRIRPLEGDLIYIPFASGTGELYEIKFVNDAADVYAGGRSMPYYYELELDAFKYSNESFTTGIEEIDVVQTDQAYEIELHVANGSWNYLNGEYVYQGSSLLTASAVAVVSDWDASNNILRVVSTKGTFVSNTNIIGESSEANYMLSNFDDIENNQNNTPWDNRYIEDEASPYINSDESNPLGTL